MNTREKLGKERYDFLVVGAGMFGAAAARALTDRGCRVLVAERRGHIAGNAYTEYVDGICVHRYGAHIFHTDDERVWEFVNRFARFNGYVHRVIADYHGESYSLPFNMNTFRELWGVTEPEDARRIIDRQAAEAGCGAEAGEAVNLEDYAIRQVGTDIYEKLIRGYTEKQWGRPCRELPASIISRIPVRFEYDNRYFGDRYQGIPAGGYTAMAARMLEGIDVLTGTDFLEEGTRERLEAVVDRIIFTGQIDEFYGYCYGPLEYRSLRFETVAVTDGACGSGYFQPCAVVNYTDAETPWTRIIEHRHFEEDGTKPPVTVITREYPAEWRPGDEAFYPVCDERNLARYERYRSLADKEDRVIFGGRLGSYRYYDMDDAIAAALSLADDECEAMFGSATRAGAGML